MIVLLVPAGVAVSCVIHFFFIDYFPRAKHCSLRVAVKQQMCTSFCNIAPVREERPVGRVGKVVNL